MKWKGVGYLRSAALILGVGIAIILPLYGDPRSTPVSHAEWARMLLRAVELDAVLPTTAQASTAFSILAWKESLVFNADKYVQADGVVIKTIAGQKVATTAAVSGEVRYSLTIARPGDYRIRVRMRAEKESSAFTEILPYGQEVPLKTFPVNPSLMPAWLDAGRLHLDRGSFLAAILMPPATILERIELIPPCLNPIEPIGGWHATATTQTGDVAVTVIQALNWEGELPTADTSIEMHGSDFETPEAPGRTRTVAAGVEAFFLKAGRDGTRAVVTLPIPETGLYSVSVFGLQGSGQRWMIDSCHKAILCPTDESGPAWHTVLNGRFTAGRHFVNVTLAPGATVERMRIYRKKDTSLDYADTLRRLGFDVGEPGPISRSRAVDAMQFIASRRHALIDEYCGDIIEGKVPTPGMSVDGNPIQPPIPPPFVGPGVTPPDPGGGSAPPPLSPPTIPPEPPGSPVVP